jgi:nucleotide-binding universal stress UspA family protein
VKNEIVVGYDGSTSSLAAMEWAAAEADLRGARLRIVTCGRSAEPSGTNGGASDPAAELRRRHPQVSCEWTHAVGPPREVLVAESESADLVVVGKTGSGAVKLLVLGSVANSVVRRSACPSVLVPASFADRAATHRIAVGFDGSPSSREALDWAIAEATVRSSELVLLRAWSYSYDGPARDSADAVDAARVAAGAQLDEAVATTRTSAPGITVRGHLVEATACDALLDESESVDLLVVGSRGRSGLRSALLGSVAHAVTEHATCPTVVLRAR